MANCPWETACTNATERLRVNFLYSQNTADILLDGLKLQCVSNIFQEPTCQMKFPMTLHWEKLTIDYCKIQSKSYLLMVDYYSRYPVIRRLNITTSNATIDILTQVFREHRVLKAVMPDNGTVKLLQASTALTGAACLSSQHVGSAIWWSRVQALLWPIARFFLSCPKFKSLAMLVNNQLVASCQLVVLILLCSVCIICF